MEKTQTKWKQLYFAKEEILKTMKEPNARKKFKAHLRAALEDARQTEIDCEEAVDDIVASFAVKGSTGFDVNELLKAKRTKSKAIATQIDIKELWQEIFNEEMKDLD